MPLQPEGPRQRRRRAPSVPSNRVRPVQAAAAALLTICLAAATAVKGAATPVWVWSDYENNVHYRTGMPGYMLLCMEALRRNAPPPDFEIHVVDKTSIRSLVPDMPPEFDRLPYAAATSDLIRTALIAHHGGLYLDTDFLVVGQMSDVANRLASADFVAYESWGQNCAEGSFSSNFIAGRRGNPLSTRAWESIKAALKQRCLHRDGDAKQGVCCYTKEGKPRECHIPWAALGEKTSHPIALELVKSGGLRVSCYDVAHGFVPNVDNSPNMIDDYRLDNFNAQWRKVRGCAGQCPCVRQKNDLRCSYAPPPGGDGEVMTANVTGYFNRLAYHLFASTLTAAEKNLTQQELLLGDWAVSELYRKALGAGPGARVRRPPKADTQPSSAGERRRPGKKVGVKDPFRRREGASEGGDGAAVDNGVVVRGHARKVKKGVTRSPDLTVPDFAASHPPTWALAAVGVAAAALCVACPSRARSARRCLTRGCG